MKTSSRFLITAIAGAVLFGWATSLIADEPTQTGNPVLKKDQGVIPKLTIPGGSLAETIHYLKSIWEKSDPSASLNIFLADDIKKIPIAGMELRNVSIEHAFELVAEVGGCSINPIRSRIGKYSNEVIGYNVYRNNHTTGRRVALPTRRTVLDGKVSPEKASPLPKPTDIHTITIPLFSLEPNQDLDSYIATIFQINKWGETDVQVSIHKPLNIMIVRGSKDACDILLRAMTDAINHAPEKPQTTASK